MNTLIPLVILVVCALYFKKYELLNKRIKAGLLKVVVVKRPPLEELRYIVSLTLGTTAIIYLLMGIGIPLWVSNHHTTYSQQNSYQQRGY